jgi:hypothetical protein
MKEAPTAKDNKTVIDQRHYAVLDNDGLSLRDRGLHPIQILVPDTQSPEFAEEARRQSEAVRDDPHEKEIFDFIDAVMDYSGWV